MESHVSTTYHTDHNTFCQQANGRKAPPGGGENVGRMGLGTTIWVSVTHLAYIVYTLTSSDQFWRRTFTHGFLPFLYEENFKLRKRGKRKLNSLNEFSVSLSLCDYRSAHWRCVILQNARGFVRECMFVCKWAKLNYIIYMTETNSKL